MAGINQMQQTHGISSGDNHYYLMERCVSPKDTAKTKAPLFVSFSAVWFPVPPSICGSLRQCLFLVSGSPIVLADDLGSGP